MTCNKTRSSHCSRKPHTWQVLKRAAFPQVLQVWPVKGQHMQPVPRPGQPGACLRGFSASSSQLHS